MDGPLFQDRKCADDADPVSGFLFKSHEGAEAFTSQSNSIAEACEDYNIILQAGVGDDEPYEAAVFRRDAGGMCIIVPFSRSDP